MNPPGTLGLNAEPQMIPNIDAQLDELIDALTPYWEELRAQQRQIMRRLVTQPIEFYTLGFKYFRSLQQNPQDILSGKTSDPVRGALQQLLDPATTDEQKRVRADILADFSIHVISERIVARYPAFDFVAIKKRHDAKRADRLKLSSTNLFAIVLAVAAFVGKSVPQVVIEKDLGLQAAQFERWVFYGTCALLGYVGLLFILEWLPMRRKLEKHAFFSRILSYLELSAPKPKAEQAKTNIEE